MKGIGRSIVHLTVLCMLFSFTANVEGNQWRGLVPLQSTRRDAERLLGKPGKHGRYQFKEERAYIEFAGPGPCDPANACLCLVSEDTIISIFVELEVEMSFSRLRLNKTKYVRQVSPPDPNLATYSNEDDGLIYTVDEINDDMISIEYIPTTKACKDAQKRNRKTLNNGFAPTRYREVVLTSSHLSALLKMAAISSLKF